MPKYRVTKCVDSYAHYSTIVEADNADAAVAYAQEHEYELIWHQDGVSEYDNVDWANIEPEELPEDYVSCDCCDEDKRGSRQMMDFADALQIVLDLAKRAMADPDEEEAINQVEDYAVNFYGEDE